MRWLFVLIILLLTACSGGSEKPVPRRDAYPRPVTLDSVRADVDSLPVRLAVNAAATVSRPQPLWLDVAFPMYRATWHITVTPTDTAAVAAVRANRMERLMLNTGDIAGRQAEWVNPAGFDILLVSTPGASTPLQFLATDDSSLVVSGALYMADPRAAAAVDSMAPVLDIWGRDIVATLDSLDYANH